MKHSILLGILFLMPLIYACKNNDLEKITQKEDYSYIKSDPTFRTYAQERNKEYNIGIKLKMNQYMSDFEKCMAKYSEEFLVADCLGEKSDLFKEYYLSGLKIRELAQIINTKFPEYIQLDSDTRYEILKSLGVFDASETFDYLTRQNQY